MYQETDPTDAVVTDWPEVDDLPGRLWPAAEWPPTETPRERAAPAGDAMTDPHRRSVSVLPRHMH